MTDTLGLIKSCMGRSLHDPRHARLAFPFRFRVHWHRVRRRGPSQWPMHHWQEEQQGGHSQCDALSGLGF